MATILLVVLILLGILTAIAVPILLLVAIIGDRSPDTGISVLLAFLFDRYNR